MLNKIKGLKNIVFTGCWIAVFVNCLAYEQEKVNSLTFAIFGIILMLTIMLIGHFGGIFEKYEPVEKDVVKKGN